jgi:type II secretory pathway predicted ATPase ExeA
MGGKARFHKAEVMAQAADLLAAEENERHRRVVIILDDGHLLTAEQLEEIRLLTLCREPDHAERAAPVTRRCWSRPRPPARDSA